MILYCARCRDTDTPIVAHVIWKGESLCWKCMNDRIESDLDALKRKYDPVQDRREIQKWEDGRMTIIDEASDVTPEMFERVQPEREP